MSRKGGVGKTTITLALGSTFAMMRGDRVVALDANPDAGNLAHRVARPCPRTITDVLNEMELITSYSDLRRFTAQAPDSRLEVLASDDDPRIGLALNRQAYHRVIELLDHYYNLIVIDTGTGILDSANQGLLGDADQLVLVLKPALDGARAAALTLDWLAEHGHGELVARAVVVINGTRKGTGIPLDRVADHFSRRCAKVVTVPSDPSLESGAQTLLSAMQPATRDALVELAAAVADHFATHDVLRGFDVPRKES
jgi:putative peptide zinc metalloprotease protein